VTVPDPNPLADRDVIVFQGGAPPFDRQLASTIYCVDDEIIKCSKRSERRMRDVMPQTTSLNWQTAYNISCWDAEDVARLKKLWATGKSAAQIARLLGYSRNAVCAKLPTSSPRSCRCRSESRRCWQRAPARWIRLCLRVPG
jgi:hypothetical protein